MKTKRAVVIYTLTQIKQPKILVKKQPKILVKKTTENTC